MRLFTNEFLFSDQRRHYLARHGLFWLTWAVFSALTYAFIPAGIMHSKGVPWPLAYTRGLLGTSLDSVVYTPVHMLFTYGIIYWLLPRFLLRERYGPAVGVFLLILLATVALSATLSNYVLVPLRAAIGAPTARDSFANAMMAGLRGGITIGGFATAIKLVKVWYLKQQAYQQIEREKLSAELQLLKAQVHPHFLFNTLNNLYALTLRQSERAPAVVLKLSELLSYMLYDCNAAEVPLAKEIAFLRNYIGLEQLRYGDRLDMSVTITGDYERKLLAPLLLVPFLENAFKHGTSEQLEQAWMHLELSVQDTTLKFKLINSREPVERDATYVGGIGLQNVQKRLHLLYPDRHELRLVPAPETFMVLLSVELSVEPAPARPAPVSAEYVH